ncbi:hypothetical protein AaE_009459 [Aphanomyces astaci]|uniref:Uncharacterized protein n=1 Tax=Aphanomyces astaci TaxID=112090 RepID=A0A6A5AAF0_APHAT|nr:hypothetical protein AaE_009459 [Aphanomyces astaci]
MVSDIAFTNVHCTCLTPLFSKKYLRSHRSNGTKVLRCFPHCCPTHVDGTYCGSPLAVVVTVASPGKLTQCSVDFRIESSNDTTMSCGDTVESHRVVANRRHPSNPSAEWLPTRVVAKKARYTSECDNVRVQSVRRVELRVEGRVIDPPATVLASNQSLSYHHQL